MSSEDRSDRPLVRFGRFWARAVVTGGKTASSLGGVVVLVIGGSGVAYWQETHGPHRIWWIVGGAVVLILVLMFAAYRQWDEADREGQRLSREIQQLLRQKVPNEHRDQIHELLRALLPQISSGRAADFGDADIGEPLNQMVLMTHLPDLADELDAWDSAVNRAANSVERLKRALIDDASRRKLPRPEFDAWETVIDDLSTFVIERARVGNLGAPIRLNWDRTDYTGVHGPSPGPGRELQVTLGQKAVAHLPARPAPAATARYSTIIREVNSLVEAVADGPEAIELRDASASKDDLMDWLRSLINEWLRVTVFVVDEDCPTCRRNLGLAELEPGMS